MIQNGGLPLIVWKRENFVIYYSFIEFEGLVSTIMDGDNQFTQLLLN